MKYHYYEIPPNDSLFSRRWLHRDEVNSEVYEKKVHNDIDSTNRKLEDLETKLSAKLIIDYGPAYVGDHLLDTVILLNSYIGVWNVYTDDNIRYIQTRAQLDKLKIKMIHPDNTRVMSKWEEVVLGGVQREGVCVDMLSPQCVEWLNRISDWVGE